MAETVLVSPGVLTFEVDGTVRPADPLAIGPVFIGPRGKGPAFMPTLIKDPDQDQAVFGPPNKNGRDLAAYTSQLYLRQDVAPVTTVRVLGQEGTNVTPGFSVPKVTAIGASGSNVVAIIHSSGTVALAGTLTSSVDALAISIAGYGDVTASLNRNASNYIGKVLNTDPTQFETKKHYVEAVYDFASKTPSVANAFFAAELPSSAGTLTDGFITGSTTTIISQPFGVTEYNLFGFGSIFAGDSANTEVKVTISNIRKAISPNVSEFGSFTVQVRRFYDNDKQPEVLESFTNVTLDPNDRNYICKRIGDRYKVWNSVTKKHEMVGDYPNKSNYIYVTPSLDLVNGNVPETALPYGFTGYRKFGTLAVANKATFPSLPYVSTLTYKGDFNTKVCWGVEAISNVSGTTNHGVPDKLKHVAKVLMGLSGTTDSNFSLKYLSGTTGNASGYSATSRLSDVSIGQLSTSIQYNTGLVAGTALTLENIENTALAKFTFVMNDGFDGLNKHKADPLSSEDMTTDLAYQVHAYRTALDMISNADEYDLNLLAIPGVYASKVTNYALDKVEDRGDMFYVMEISGSSVTDAIADVAGKELDTSYAGVYYPSVRLRDAFNDKTVTVPPSVVMPAAIAINDRVAYPWFAPAGLSRGGLSQLGVSEAVDKLTRDDRDKLQENRINPIATFPQEGVVVWGQKTLQLKSSALDRINVRRMLLTIRKVIAKIGRKLVFEPNVQATWDRFSNEVNPYLARVRKNFGVDDFKVLLDERTTTQDLVDRNIMFAKIAIKPTRSAEYLYIGFYVTNNVAGFTE